LHQTQVLTAGEQEARSGRCSNAGHVHRGKPLQTQNHLPTVEFLTARQTWERYGVTQMTLWRWLRNEAMNFPQPVYFGRFRYFRLSELEAWEQNQPRRAA